jgi:hypothetical protein
MQEQHLWRGVVFGMTERCSGKVPANAQRIQADLGCGGAGVGRTRAEMPGEDRDATGSGLYICLFHQSK